MSFWSSILPTVAGWFAGPAAAQIVGGAMVNDSSGLPTTPSGGGQASQDYSAADASNLATQDFNGATPGYASPSYQVNIDGSTQKPNPYIAPAIGAASSLITGGLSYLGATNQNSANAQQAQQQMDFQADQTGTAYQRAVADMQKAGLNPMLAYSQGGAQSGSGAQAVLGNAVGSGASSALGALSTIAGLGQTVANTDNLDAVTKRTESETALNALHGYRVMAETERSHASAGQARALTNSIMASLKGTLADSDVKENTVGARTDYERARARGTTAEATLSGLAIPRARNQSEAESSSWMQNVDPYLKSVGSLLNSAGSLRRFID